ncbi:MAG: hypothetical protein EP330_00395 [Deltaproteobacteria bacterium]|nr:MAG: hypothetical protein EP330_00395 [Deltaproteobacteria bacterium]
MRPLPLILLVLSGCLIGPKQTRERLDLDGDGSLWPDDCDDANDAVSPDLAEQFDGIDNDCDGVVDEAGDTGGEDTDLPPIDGTEILPFGSTWHYLDASDPPSFWLDEGYPYQNWPSGPGQLGYGDGDEATVLYDGGSPGQRITRVAFMGDFQLSAPLPAELILDLYVDDGIAVYLNGTEVVHHNLPAGTPATDTLALADAEGRDERQRFTIDTLAAIEGTNVLAASVHQSSRQSQDLSFDLAVWIPN